MAFLKTINKLMRCQEREMLASTQQEKAQASKGTEAVKQELRAQGLEDNAIEELMQRNTERIRERQRTGERQKLQYC